jgi:hypothetical protein
MYELATMFADLLSDSPSRNCFGPSVWECYDLFSRSSPETLPQRIKRERCEQERAAAAQAAETYLQRHNAALREARRLANALWDYSELRPTTRALQRLIDETESVQNLRDVRDFSGGEEACATYEALSKRWDEEANRRSGPRRTPKLRLWP